MSKSNLIEKREKEKNDFGDEVQTVIYRFPKTDHNKMVEFTKPFTDIFRKHGVLQWGIFQLKDTENMVEFTNQSVYLSNILEDSVIALIMIFDL